MAREKVKITDFLSKDEIENLMQIARKKDKNNNPHCEHCEDLRDIIDIQTKIIHGLLEIVNADNT